MLHRSEYLESLKSAIFINHKCRPIHQESAFVHVETKDGQTVWKGQVEIFDLAGHKDASTCYAWQNSGNGNAKIFAILGNNFIDSPKKAVQAAIFMDEERPTPEN